MLMTALGYSQRVKGRQYWTNLEGNGVIVVASVNLLGNPTVGAISSDDDINLQGGRCSYFAGAVFVVVVVQSVCAIVTILHKFSLFERML